MGTGLQQARSQCNDEVAHASYRLLKPFLIRWRKLAKVAAAGHSLIRVRPPCAPHSPLPRPRIASLPTNAAASA